VLAAKKYKPLFIVIKKIFAVLSALYVVMYVLSCLTPYLHPKQFSFSIILGLGFPILLAGMLLLVFIGLFIHKKTALLFFVLIFIGWQNIFSTFAFHVSQKFIVAKDSSTLRIMSWNVMQFDNCSIGAEPDKRGGMFNTINDVKPDIILFQDFVDFYNCKGYYCNTAWLDSLGYHYFYCTSDLVLPLSNGFRISGVAIASKVPIIDSSKKYYTNTVFSESFLIADVLWQQKRVRIFNTHLQSMFLHNVDGVTVPEIFPKKSDSILVNSHSQLTKLQHFDSIHATQALLTKKTMNQSPYPIILCGDFNSTPTNYSYHILSQGLQDAFIQKGSGIGVTYDGKSPTIRIDYILPSKQFTVKQYYSPKLKLSDHFPVVTDIKWKD
jgi:endonuclease/exonuclease/phosphatase family metal-dependent hydrolase